MRQTVLAVLEIRDEADIIRGLDRGELEARALHGQRAQAAAPPDVSRQLRLTAQAEADARRQAADAQTRHDHTATALAAQLAAERHHLETANTRYEQWSAETRITRDTAGKAAAELQRRGHPRPGGEPHQQPEEEPQPMAGWRQLEADAEAVNRADTSVHQAVSTIADLRPLQRLRDMNPSASRPEVQTGPENEPAQQDRAARLDELLTKADQAAQRITAQQAQQQASSDYAARMELEAQTQAEAGHEAEARDELELEL